MYELFTQLKTDNASVYKSADLDNVSSAYKRQVDTLVAYYHSKAMFVNNEHLLVRIIKLAVSSLNYSIEHYASVIDQRVPNVERHFQLCSSISTGIFHKSVFFTGCDELLISDRGYFNPHIALKNWTKLQPVKVLSSCITNLGLNMPIPRAQNSERGENMFSINITMLLVMFYGYCRYKAHEQKFQEVSVRVAEFVHMFVLPNMYYSHTDAVFFNRFRSMYYGIPLGASYKRPPLAVIDYSEKLDRVYKDIIDRFTDVPYSYTSLLKSLPSISNKAMDESLLMPDVAPTVQVQWALILTRLKHMELIVDLLGPKGRIYNSSHIGYMKRDLNVIKRSKQFNSRLGKDLAYDTNLLIEKLLSI